MMTESRIRRSESIAHLAAAMAQARMKFLPLGKDKSASIVSKKGASYSYDYADLADSYDAVIAALSEQQIAVFQPVSIEGDSAVATTLLAHASGEWIESDLAMPIDDVRDARAVGSAATYAKRYGLQSMVAISPADSDDDGEAARGGNHEMARSPARPPKLVCPVCGKDAVIKGKAEYGGGWLCFGKKGGCGTKWPDGPFPTAPPPGDVLDLPPGTTTEAQANAEGDALFPTEAPEDAQALLEAIKQRFKLVKSSLLQEKLWKEFCGVAPFETIEGVDVGQLNGLLARLGGSVAR